MARRVLHLAERTWTQTEATSQTAPGQRPKLQPAAAYSQRRPPLWSEARPSDGVSGLESQCRFSAVFSGRSVDSTPPWRLSCRARFVLHLKAASTVLRS